MKITVSQVVSWVFGLFFILVGFLNFLNGLVFQQLGDVIAGFILATTGTIVTPKTRTLIDDKWDIQFSRWLIVSLVIFTLIITGPLTSDSIERGTASPSEVTEAFVTNLYSDDPDYDTFRSLINPEAVEENFTEQQFQETANELAFRDTESVNAEFLGIVNESIDGNEATVYYEIEVRPNTGLDSRSRELLFRAELEEVDGTWKFNNTYNADE